jgi:anti-sigma B factor antagonist
MVLTPFRMEWNELAVDGLIIVTLKGDIDLQHSPEMRQLLQCKAHIRTPSLLLDFSAVKYIDSSGLATLVEYYQNSRSYSGRIALAGLTERVRSIFDLVRLSEIFPIYSNLEEAKQGLLQSAAQ